MADQAIYSPQRVLDENGDPVAGAKVTFYASGTLTMIDVWQDAAGSVASTNPVVADADGNLPQRFVGEAAKAVITDADDATLRTIDPVPVSLTSAGAAGLVSFSPTTNIPAANVQAAIVMVDTNSRARDQAVQNTLDLLGDMAFKDEVGVSDIDATGTADATTFLRGDGVWAGVDTWGQQYSVVSRAVDTTYQNTTGRPISVGFSVTSSGASALATIRVSDTATMPTDPTVGNSTPTTASTRVTVWARIPAGHYYRFAQAGGVGSSYFMELS